MSPFLLFSISCFITSFLNNSSIMINRFQFVLTSMVIVSILYAGDVVSMGHLYYSLADIPTSKSMIRCDAFLLLSRRSSSCGFFRFSFESVRLHLDCVIDSNSTATKLRQILQNQIWDPGSSRLEIGEEDMKSRSDSIHINTVCRSTQDACVDRHKSGTVANSAVGAFFFLALVLVDAVNRMRIRRSNQQHVWVYGTITKLISSFSGEFQNLWSCDVTDGSQTLPFKSVKDGTSTKNRCFPSYKVTQD